MQPITFATIYLERCRTSDSLFSISSTHRQVINLIPLIISRISCISPRVLSRFKRDSDGRSGGEKVEREKSGSVKLSIVVLDIGGIKLSENQRISELHISGTHLSAVHRICSIAVHVNGLVTVFNRPVDLAYQTATLISRKKEGKRTCVRERASEREQAGREDGDGRRL